MSVCVHVKHFNIPVLITPKFNTHSYTHMHYTFTGEGFKAYLDKVDLSEGPDFKIPYWEKGRANLQKGRHERPSGKAG